MEPHLEKIGQDELDTDHGGDRCEWAQSYTDYDGSRAWAQCTKQADWWLVIDVPPIPEGDDPSHYSGTESGQLAVQLCRPHANLALIEARKEQAA